MSELPRGWSEASLDDFCQIIRGITFPTTDKRYEYADGLIACLRTANVQSMVEWDDLWFVPKKHVKNDGQLVTLNDVLISTANSYELVGKVSRITHVKQPATLGAFISLLRAANGIDAGFLYYQIASETSQRSIREMSSTTTNISNVSGTKLKTLNLHLAPFPEQTRIVTKLEELLSDLDAGVAELKAAQKKLAQYRQSLLKAAVDGSLTAEWRKNNQPSETGTQLLERILKERRARWEAKQLAKFQEQGKTPPKDWQKKYPEPVLPSTTDLPELPLWWTLATTGLIAESIVPNRDKPLTFTGHIPWVTTPDFERTDLHLKKSISGFGLSENECEMYRARVVPSQSVIMTCVGRFGLSAVLDVRAVINQQLHAFIPESGIRAEYLAFVIQAQRNWLERNATSTTIAYLNKEKCESLPVPLPPVNEQDAVLNLLKPQLASIKVQLRNVGFSLKQAAAQRQNILRAAFAGQLVPQDPNDEPASILLERIRTERATRDAVRKPSRRKMKETRNA